MIVQEQQGALEPVRVRPLRTQRQLEELAVCESMMIHRPEIDIGLEDQVDELREWLEVAAFELAVETGGTGSECRRRLCADVLACVRQLERCGITVLAGLMPAPRATFPGAPVAFISLAPRLRDRRPGQTVLVDRRRAELLAPEFD